jgi:hypothetical protein
LTVTKTSDLARTFVISVSGVWSVQLPATQVTPGSGKDDEIVVHVLISTSAASGEHDMTTVVVQAMGQVQVSTWAELTTTVTAPAVSIRL